MTNPELKIVISGNADKFEKELKKISSDVANTSDKLTEISTRNYKKIALAVAAIGAASATAIGVSIKAFADYETALVAAIRTTGLAGDELESFKKNIEDLSSKLAIPQTELLKISEVAGTLGVKGSENLSKFTEAMAKFDIASATLRGGEAANQIARIINLTGGGIENVDRFASEVAYLADNFNATEADIVEVSKELSSVNALFKLSTLDTIDFAAALASFGVTGEIARTAIATFSQTLDKATREGGRKLEIFMATTGMTRDELKKNLQDDPLKIFSAFSKGLSDAGENAGFVLGELGLDQARLAKVFLSASQNSDTFTAALNRQANEADRADKLNQETEKSLDTVAKRADAAKVAFNNAAIKIGEEFVPVIEESANLLKSLAPIISDLVVPAVKNLISFLTQIADTLETIIVKVKTMRMTPEEALEFRISRMDIKSNNFAEVQTPAALPAIQEQNDMYSGALKAQEDFLNSKLENLNNYFDRESEQTLENEDKKAEIQAIIDEAEAERLAEQREADLELKQEQFDEDMALLQEHLDAAVSLQNNALVKDLANQKKALQEKAKIDGLKVKGTMEVTKAEMQLRQIAVADAIAGFQAMFKSGTALSKAFFLIGKAAAIAEGIVNTNVAYTKALAETANPGYAQLIWAAGMLKVALIGATAIKEVGGAQQGGIVPGFGSGDRVPMMLEPGELVVPKQIRPTFEEYMQSKGGGGTQGVQVMIGLDENASRVLTVKQREDSKLGIQS